MPVLQLADGTIIDQSLDVMWWALQQADPDNWLDIEKQDARLLIEKTITNLNTILISINISKGILRNHNCIIVKKQKNLLCCLKLICKDMMVLG